jgi:NodT family efflux transporter outer membrane factor (OMF) lipoprotein
VADADHRWGHDADGGLVVPASVGLGDEAMRTVLGVIIAATLSACAVGPEFLRPQATSPVDWNTSDAPGGPLSRPEAGAIREKWWDLFNDPELSVLEARVVDANFDIQVATLRLAQSRAQRTAVLGGRMPSINGNASYQRQRQSEGGVNTRLIDIIRPPGDRDQIIDALAEPFNVYQAGFDASWELDLWGRVRRSVESANASLAASKSNLQDVRLSVMAELARNYLELRGLQRQLEIAGQDVKTAKEVLDLTQQRAAGGLVTDLDVVSQRARLADGRARIPRVQQQIKQTISAIALLLGREPGALEAELTPIKAVPAVPPRVPIGVPSEVARRRPDIRAAEERLHAATADIGIAIADLYPRIMLTGSFEMQALNASDVSDWGARQWAVGPSLSLPIFDGHRRRATVELRKAQQQEAAVNYQRIVLQAWHEIDNALAAYANEQRRHEALAEALTASRAAFELANDRYTHGLTNFLVALDAQRTLLQAERDYADSTTAISTRLVALYKALGGGWRSEDPAHPG